MNGDKISVLNIDVNDPVFFSGGFNMDDRGEVTFINEFDFKEEGVVRFYKISNHAVKFCRAFHGHRYETKFITPLVGNIRVVTAKVFDWEKGLTDTPKISDVKPGAMLKIPPGHVNGWMNYDQDNLTMFYSDRTLEESEKDDIRFPYNLLRLEVWGGQFR